MAGGCRGAKQAGLLGVERDMRLSVVTLNALGCECVSIFVRHCTIDRPRRTAFTDARGATVYICAQAQR
ncbi:hypothetical protein JANAI61_13240 [Jannaschia sp. AI_61]|nr:hypothetical protein JANAI61_13240 [Jannaschia sp. AI_61]